VKKLSPIQTGTYTARQFSTVAFLLVAGLSVSGTAKLSLNLPFPRHPTGHADEMTVIDPATKVVEVTTFGYQGEPLQILDKSSTSC